MSSLWSRSECRVPEQAQDGTCTEIAHCYSCLLSWGRAGARYHPPHTLYLKLLPWVTACEFWLKTKHKSGLKPYLDYEGEVIESHLVVYTLYFTFVSAIIRPSPRFLLWQEMNWQCTAHCGKDKVTASKQQNDRNTKKDDKIFEMV